MFVDLNLIRRFTVTKRKDELTEFERKRAEREIEKVKALIDRYKQ